MKNMTIWVTLAALLASGCGGDPAGSTSEASEASEADDSSGSSEGDGGSIHGVPADTPSNELTDEEREQLCAGLVADYAETGVHAAECKLEGYTSAELTGSMDAAVLRQACSERYDTCLDEKLLLTSPGGNLCSPASNCSGSVEQGVACVIEAGEGTISATSILPECDAITFEDLTLPYEIQLPPAPACAAFNQTCV